MNRVSTRSLKAVFLNSSLTLFIIFLFLNSLKVTLFYYFILEHDESIYLPLLIHFVTTFVIASTFFLIIFRSSKPYFFLIAYILQAAFLFVNEIYFYYFYDFIHLNYYFLITNELYRILNHLEFVIDKKFLMVFLDLPLLILLIYSYTSVHSLIIRNSFRCRVVILSGILITVIFYSMYPALTRDDDYTVVKDYGILTHYFFDLAKIKKELHPLSEISYGNKVVIHSPNSHRANVLMIQVESLDANIINTTYRGRYITPFLHDLSQKSIYYPYALSYRRAGGTSDCEVAVLNSLESLENYPIMKLESYSYPNCIVEKLNKQGYRTIAFHGNAGRYWNRNKAYKQMNFDEFYDRRRMGLKVVGWGAPDKDVFEYVKNTLSSENKNFFYYIITMSSHEPFTLVKQYYIINTFDDVEPALTRNYFSSIQYVDNTLRDFITTFRKKYKNTFIFIYGDHTPYVIDEGDYKRTFFILDHRGFEFVPLIILTPDNRIYREEHRVAGYLDFAPTVLSAAGGSFEIRTSGLDLLRTPITDDNIKFRGQSYDRKLLFKQAENIPKYH